MVLRREGRREEGVEGENTRRIDERMGGNR